ncbi:MAG TPA: hypothetical protein VNT30_10810 [Stellaceae bacterium]|nr:hypothetical protein [Stellaceae bacterium]
MTLTDDAIIEHAVRHGLPAPTPEEVAQLRILTLRAAASGQAIPRQTSKWVEPAPVFQVRALGGGTG